MISILFVDDDASLTAGLRRSMRSHRDAVAVEFAAGADQAMKCLAERRIDIVVTDLKMPGIDGVSFLRDVERDFPVVIRIVLSGEGTSPLLIRSLGVAHRVVGKPCEASTLLALCLEAANFRMRIHSEEARRLIAGISQLPSPPQVCKRVEQAVAREAPLSEIGSIVAEDPALSAKLLQVSNSAFFGSRRKVSSTQLAVSMLGLETTKSILFAAGIRDSMRATDPRIEAAIEATWTHSNRVAALATAISATLGMSRSDQAECFSAGILHDIGKMLLLKQLANVPNSSSDHDTVREGFDGVVDLERRIFGAEHAQVGAHLLSLWGVPDDIVEVVLTHEDDPTDLPPTTSQKTRITIAADLTDRAENGDPHARTKIASICGDSELGRLISIATREAACREVHAPS